MEATALTDGTGTIGRSALSRAVRRLAGPDAVLTGVRPLADDRADTELKHIGYGEPLLLSYRIGGEGARKATRKEGHERRLVFRTMAPNWFGHDRRSDRAALALLAADTYDVVPRHVRVADVGVIGPMGELVSLHESGEFYLVTSYADGELYARDLRAVQVAGKAGSSDIARARALCLYLTELHAAPLRQDQPELYARAIRDLVGSGEGIFGIVDSYPDKKPVARERLDAIERLAVAWRARLRGRSDRLRHTHGDFHPYNVLFREGVDFTVLDASRGSVGDPADDVAAMAINYLFGGVVAECAWAQGFRPLWDTFWQTYLEATRDDGLLEVVGPFLAWRALVVASPVWYPTIPSRAREALLSFAEAALDSPAFDPTVADRFVG